MKKCFNLDKINVYRGAIMGFAALLIFVFHEWEFLFTNVPLVGGAERFVKRIAFCGADIFFLLSGIGLTYAIEKTNLLTFYRKRFVRIGLPFLVTGIIFALRRNWSWDVLLKNISGWNFFTKHICSFLWFVPAIALFYLLFPLYYKAFKRASSKLRFTLIVWVIWLAASVLLADVMRVDLFGVTNRIPVFTAGVFIGWMLRERKLELSAGGWCLCIAGFVLGLILAYLTNFKNVYLLVPESNCALPHLLIAVCGTCLLAKAFDLVSRWGVLKIFEFYGAISLEFYCVQEAVGLEIRYYIGKVLLGNWLTLVELICSTLLALALHGICLLIRKLASLVARKLRAH